MLPTEHDEEDQTTQRATTSNSQDQEAAARSIQEVNNNAGEQKATDSATEEGIPQVVEVADLLTDKKTPEKQKVEEKQISEAKDVANKAVGSYEMINKRGQSSPTNRK